MQQAVSKQLARKGNYQHLRNCYFAWRQLMIEEKISQHKLTDLDKEKLKDIRFKSYWEVKEAFDLGVILRRYDQELKAHDIKIDPGNDKKTVPVPVKSRPEKKRTRTIGYFQGNFIVSLPYDARVVAIIRESFKRKYREYDKEKQIWKIHESQREKLAKIARNHDFNVGDKAHDILFEGSTNLEQSYSCERVNLELPIKHRLFDYQTVGVDYCNRIKRSWLADQMGLGKTPQAICTAVAINTWPVIVLCPKSLRENWKLEIESWTNYKAMVATHRNMKKINAFIEHDMCHFLIMNYEGMKTFFVNEIKIVKGKNDQKRTLIYTNGKEKLFKGIIIDESHELKNPKTTRYKCVKKGLKHMEYRQLLTGTPIVNSVSDASAQLDLIGRLDDDFGGYLEFNKRFKKPKGHRFEKEQARNLALLNEELRSKCMIRREKHQVLHELPDKFRTIIPVELTNRKEYDHAQVNLQDYLTTMQNSPAKISQSMNAELLVRLSLLKKISARGKIESIVEVVKQQIEQGEKAILFCWFYETIDALKEAIPYNTLEISGRVSDGPEIEYTKKQFQEDPNYPVIIITYKKGGTGHTLTAANNVHKVEPAWTAKDHDQAEDRAHRIGQKDNVNVFYWQGIKTIDQHIYGIIDRKRNLAKESTDSTEEIQSVQSELTKILLQELPK